MQKSGKKCDSCRRSDERVERLERELAQCQEYMRNQTVRSDKLRMNANQMNSDLAVQLDKVEIAYENLKGEHSKVIAERDEAMRTQKEAVKECQAATEKALRLMLKVKNLEAEIQCLREKDLKETSVEQMQEGKTEDKENINLLSADSKTRHKSPLDKNLQEERRKLNEMKFMLEVHSPIMEIRKLEEGYQWKPADLVKVRKTIDVFTKQFHIFKEILENNLSILESPNPSLNKLRPMPEFPDCFSPEILCLFEMTSKSDKYRFEIDNANCRICKQHVDVTNDAFVECERCEQPYHPDCARIFAQQGLNCMTPKCSTKFGTSWL